MLETIKYKNWKEFFNKEFGLATSNFERMEVHIGWQKDMKEFIVQLLQSQTQDIKKKIKGMEKDYENREVGKDGFCQGCNYLQCKCLGYNQAIQDILLTLSDMAGKIKE